MHRVGLLWKRDVCASEHAGLSVGAVEFLTSAGYLTRTEGGIAATPKGRLALNAVLSELLN